MTTRVFGPNPGALRLVSYIPQGLVEGSALVVVLHGCTQTARDYAVGAGWIDLADRFGFALLCPEQTSANNPNRCFNWFEPGDTARDCGEVASIAAMVGQLLSDHSLDPAKVFVTGLSAGGAMTASLAAAYPDVFAGAAIIAGLPHGAAGSMGEAFRAMSGPAPLSPDAWGDKVRSASHAGRSWPVISIWHGAADATVRPAAADALVSQWTDVHGVAGPSTPAQTPDGRRFEIWRTPSGRVVVEHHRFAGMGHGTPVKGGGGLEGTAGAFLLDVGTASSLEIAMGWGIADNAMAKSPARPDSVSNALHDPREIRPPRMRAGAAQASDLVTETIEKALRTAGLMK